MPWRQRRVEVGMARCGEARRVEARRGEAKRDVVHVAWWRGLRRGKVRLDTSVTLGTEMCALVTRKSRLLQRTVAYDRVA